MGGMGCKRCHDTPCTCTAPEILIDEMVELLEQAAPYVGEMPFEMHKEFVARVQDVRKRAGMRR